MWGSSSLFSLHLEHQVTKKQTDMRKLIITLLPLLLTALSAPAQIFTPSDPIGTQATYTTTWKDGKSSTEQLTLHRVKGNNVWSSVPGGSDEIPISEIVLPDGVYYSMDELRTLVRQKMTGKAAKLAKVELNCLSGDRFRMLPLQGTPGQTFPDQTLDVKAKVKLLGLLNLHLTMTIEGDKILRRETRKTPLGEVSTIVRSYTMVSKTDVKVMGKREEEVEREEITQWIIPGRGLFREEKRKGKELSVKELTDFKRP